MDQIQAACAAEAKAHYFILILFLGWILLGNPIGATVNRLQESVQLLWEMVKEGSLECCSSQVTESWIQLSYWTTAVVLVGSWQLLLKMKWKC